MEKVVNEIMEQSNEDKAELRKMIEIALKSVG
jgi:uncharacterized protein YpuA (DUF1002 family)